MATAYIEKNINAMGNECDATLEYAVKMGLSEIHFKADPESGLFAIVGIHSTKRGPALGGCRCIHYHNLQDALIDAVRLAQGMTYKAAISGLPQGGGKSVLIRPHHIPDREAYFSAFGKFLNDLGGRYITAVDSGTSPADMDIIAKHTPYVTSTTSSDKFHLPGDPSPFTATGVRRGIEAAVYFKLGKSKLDGLHIAIQGVGNVGYHLAKELYERGVKLTVCDISPLATARCEKEFGATVVNSDEIFNVVCDVFAPCALGAIINDNHINMLNTTIVAGSANNQLAETFHGKVLHERGILYAPDYVVNAGGLIHAVAQYHQTSLDEANQQIDNIYDTLLTIFERSKNSNIPTSEIADTIAREKLEQS